MNKITVESNTRIKLTFMHITVVLFKMALQTLILLYCCIDGCKADRSVPHCRKLKYVLHQTVLHTVEVNCCTAGSSLHY